MMVWLDADFDKLPSEVVGFIFYALWLKKWGGSLITASVANVYGRGTIGFAHFDKTTK